LSLGQSEIENNSPIASIILAAGKGTRMGSTEMQKVCFPINGTPAILRSLRTYASCGIHPHVVVVGHCAEQVMECLRSEFDNVFFTYQNEQKGTGHAAKIGSKLLRDFNYNGNVLLVVGDKIIEADILHRLITTFHNLQSDVAFLVGDRESYPTSGRVVYSDDNSPLAVVEVGDIDQCTLLGHLWQKTEKAPVSAEEAASMARQLFPNENKMALALGSVWKMIERGEDVRHCHIADLTGGKYPALNIGYGLEIDEKRVQKSQLANLSVYLARANVLFRALDGIISDNAQQEEYLTDIIAILASIGGYKLNTIKVDNPNQVMAFNNRKELDDINAHMREKRHSITIAELPTTCHRSSKWLRALESDYMRNRFDRLYNDNPSISTAKFTRLRKLLKFFQTEYGDAKVIIARAPGRINLMGRHIDHQGGNCNLMAIDREIFLVVSPRDDDLVCLSNLESKRFPKREFSINRLFNTQAHTDWDAFVDSEPVRKMARGDWSQYIKAAILRFQAHFSDHSLRGMNLAVSGDIPIAAGLSSSSALVVATAEAIITQNKFQIEDAKFVELCGEAEWYVGTRGGCADHAAIKLGKSGHVVHIGFNPFEVKDVVPFPKDHSIVICDSYSKAFKSAESCTIFNQRVACYHLGRLLFVSQFPQFKSRITYLRDMVPKILNIDLNKFYQCIRSLPERIAKDELKKVLCESVVKPIFATHSTYSGDYLIREIVLYGLAECERSTLCVDLLKNNISEFGRLMNISHKGDRVVKFDGQWNETPYLTDCSDDYFEHMAALAAKGDSRANLHFQAGSYRCSTAEIDFLVDLTKSVGGVKGAQLAGAGLGGCVMVLIEEYAVEELTKVLTEKYYSSRNLEPAITECSSVAGSGVLQFYSYAN
jgi:N-acetylgalactosamine kinase